MKTLTEKIDMFLMMEVSKQMTAYQKIEKTISTMTDGKQGKMVVKMVSNFDKVHKDEDLTLDLLKSLESKTKKLGGYQLIKNSIANIRNEVNRREELRMSD